MCRVPRWFLCLASLALGGAWPGRSTAQAPDPTVLVVGTPAVSPLNQSDWGFLAWLAPHPELLRDREYAVFVKDGDADAALPYRHLGTTGPQTDPAVISALFDRSRHLGQDPFKLEASVRAYFEQIHPDMAVPVAHMMSMLIQQSFADNEIFHMLVFMGRTHPGVALCLGTGYAAPILPGTSTFELREQAPGEGDFTSVVGRVTLTAGQPVPFVAPGAPVVVPSTDRKGGALPAGNIVNHMNVKLRWSAPEALRRQTLLLRGFNVYRVTKAYAESRNWHLCPPGGPGQISWDTEVAAHFPQVAQVNRLPILPRRFYTPAEVVDFNLDPGDGVEGDLDFYTQDDNRHNGLALDDRGDGIDENGVFIPGAEFYYFAACEDLLGRVGGSSCGTLVKICDRDPPIAPTKVRVTNDFVYNPATQKSDQRLRVTWPQLKPREGVSAYYVYRWRSLETLKARAEDDPLSLGALHRVAGPIPHTGLGELTVVDNADPVHSPKIGADPTFGAVGDDAGQTLWYTVVAVDNSTCGGNPSPHSAPAYGVLRDRVGPSGGGGTVGIRCCLPELADMRNQQIVTAPPELDPNRLHFLLGVSRSGEQPEKLVSMEFWLSDQKNQIDYPIAFRDFAPDASETLIVQASIPREGILEGGVFYLNARVYQDDGRASGIVSLGELSLLPAFQYRGAYIASRSCERRPLRADIENCRLHDTLAPDGETVEPVDLGLELALGSQEWRLYRSINAGPLSLIRQGRLLLPAQAGQTLSLQDLLFTPAGGEVCYFVQYFDEHGNGGPMIDLACFAFQGLPPPTPIVARLQSLEEGGNPKARLRWFCPTANIRHFVVYITRSGGAPDAVISPDLTASGPIVLTITNDEGNEETRGGRSYTTGVVGHTLSHTGPEFSLILDKLAADNTYHVTVRSVGNNGLMSPPGNIVDFLWKTPVDIVLPEVNWPARPTPASLTPIEWDSRITARYLGTELPGFQRVGVRIGQEFGERQCAIDPQSFNPAEPVFALSGGGDPMTRIFTQGDWFSDLDTPPPPRLLPGMLYRYQVANTWFDEVSNDIVQVTPFMEHIAHRAENPIGAPYPTCNGIRIYDPHIAVSSLGGPSIVGGAVPFDLWLLDSMPVTAGARYAYLLVVFKDNGEIRTVIPAGEVDIPLNP